jgi:hypothetical protein
MSKTWRSIILGSPKASNLLLVTVTGDALSNEDQSYFGFEMRGLFWGRRDRTALICGSHGRVSGNQQHSDRNTSRKSWDFLVGRQERTIRMNSGQSGTC